MAKQSNRLTRTAILSFTLVSAVAGMACSQDESGTATDHDTASAGQKSGSGGTFTGSGGGGGTTSTTGMGGSSLGGNTVATGKTAGSGGAGTGGTRFDTAGTGGGSTATNSGRPDAGPDAFVARDATKPDALIIPDLPIRLDSAPAFWTTNYAPNCTPPAIGSRAQSDGHHRAGENCMTSGCHLNPKRANHHAGTDCRGSGCHNNGSPDGSGAPAFLYAGTAYRAGTLAAEARAEVGVKTSSGFNLACSASNGNFWYIAPSGTTSMTWTGSTARLRNASGEAPMMTSPAAGCNATACHTKMLKITAP
jgi:hypothetical protein